MKFDILSEADWLNSIKAARAHVISPYFAMYSSWADGIVTDPSLMFVPIDDHLVHRGDGIFEAARVINGAIFDLDAHLERLTQSARQLSLEMRWSLKEIKELCVRLAQISKLEEAALRLFVSRGPGHFSPNPYDSKRTELYAVVTEFKPLPESKYEKGVSIIYSKIPQKPPFFARIKSCNYLPNVLMKKESVDQKVDFSIGLDSLGFVLEGATENIICLNSEHELLIPRFEKTLRGTTLLALVEAIEQSANIGIKKIAEVDISPEILEKSIEIMMVGTTLEVLPVTQIHQSYIGDGKVGKVAPILRRILQEKMRNDSSRRTSIR